MCSRWRTRYWKTPLGVPACFVTFNVSLRKRTLADRFDTHEMGSE